MRVRACVGRRVMLVRGAASSSHSLRRVRAVETRAAVRDAEGVIAALSALLCCPDTEAQLLAVDSLCVLAHDGKLAGWRLCYWCLVYFELRTATCDAAIRDLLRCALRTSILCCCYLHTNSCWFTLPDANSVLAHAAGRAIEALLAAVGSPDTETQLRAVETADYLHAQGTGVAGARARPVACVTAHVRVCAGCIGARVEEVRVALRGLAASPDEAVRTAVQQCHSGFLFDVDL
jgi:hypothetical protein